MSAASATMHASMSPIHAFSLTSGGAMPTSSAAMSSATTMMNASLEPMARIFSSSLRGECRRILGRTSQGRGNEQMLQMKRQVNDLQAQLISEKAAEAPWRKK